MKPKQPSPKRRFRKLKRRNNFTKRRFNFLERCFAVMIAEL